MLPTVKARAPRLVAACAAWRGGLHAYAAEVRAEMAFDASPHRPRHRRARAGVGDRACRARRDARGHSAARPVPPLHLLVDAVRVCTRSSFTRSQHAARSSSRSTLHLVVSGTLHLLVVRSTLHLLVCGTLHLLVVRSTLHLLVPQHAAGSRCAALPCGVSSGIGPAGEAFDITRAATASASRSMGSPGCETRVFSCGASDPLVSRGLTTRRLAWRDRSLFAEAGAP